MDLSWFRFSLHIFQEIMERLTSVHFHAERKEICFLDDQSYEILLRYAYLAYTSPPKLGIRKCQPPTFVTIIPSPQDYLESRAFFKYGPLIMLVLNLTSSSDFGMALTVESLRVEKRNRCLMCSKFR